MQKYSFFIYNNPVLFLKIKKSDVLFETPDFWFAYFKAYYPLYAMVSISTNTPIGNFSTAYAALAGNISL